MGLPRSVARASQEEAVRTPTSVTGDQDTTPAARSKISIYHKILCPFIDALFDLVMFLSTDRGRRGKETDLPFRRDS